MSRYLRADQVVAGMRLASGHQVADVSSVFHGRLAIVWTDDTGAERVQMFRDAEQVLLEDAGPIEIERYRHALREMQRLIHRHHAVRTAEAWGAICEVCAETDPSEVLFSLGDPELVP